jgi:hypothetical protein
MKRYIVTILLALVGTLIGADFNRDGKPDLLLVNPSTRQTAIWHMNNHNLISGVYGPTVPAGWTILGIGDFNGDGYPDLFVYNPSSHQSGIWHMQDARLISAVYGPTFINGYVPIAVATFVQNAVTIMALNPSTRQLYAVNMNDSQIISQFPALSVPSGWKLVSANGPPQLGYPNIPLQNNDGPQFHFVQINPPNGRAAIWNVNYDVNSQSVTFVNGFIGVAIPVGWQLGTLLDANLDSYLDYLLFSPSDGRTAFWYLQDSTYLTGIYGPRIPTGWAPSLVADLVCAFAVSPAFINAPPNYSTYTITVDTGWDCTWTANSNAPWITIASILPKRGPNSIYIAVAAGGAQPASRTGTITVAGQTVTVSQGSTPSTWAGSLSGSVTDEGGGGCPGTAQITGSAGMTVTSNPDGTYSYSGTWNLSQQPGICDNYSGNYSFSGTVSTLNGGTTTFSWGLGNATGTFANNTFNGSWNFTAGNGPDVGSGNFTLARQ